MCAENVSVGQNAEQRAAAYLAHQGYRVIARNYRNKYGEIDIVARDGDTLCFIEVKSRLEGTEDPCAAVSEPKQRRLSRIALVFCAERGFDDCNARFDVIGVVRSAGGSRVVLIKDAFELIE
ncbi:MAG: YraN family protein [Candidatus Omnitrophica bacterium]|nr:YraN family protein [Candidatus Omnitrophota bacterium]